MSKRLTLRRKDYALKDALPTQLINGCDYLISGKDEMDSASKSNSPGRRSSVLDSVIEDRKRKTSLASGGIPANRSCDSLPFLDEGETGPVKIDTSFFESKMKEEEIDKTILVALATVLSIREVPGDNTSKELAEYVLEVFDKDEDRIRELWVKAATQEKPELKLVCNVISGSGLTSKDANGKSDPYVRLGILDAKHLNDHIVKNKNLAEWQKEEGLLPSGEVATTSVVPATLNPDWNEEVELSVGNAEDEMLVMEVWDSDNVNVGATKIKGFKGFGQFLADLRNKDDFMGRAFLSLKTIPVAEEVKRMKLCSHSGKHKYGFLNMGLVIEGVKKHAPFEVGLQEHMMLAQALVNNESRKKGQYIRKWDGKLSPLAEKFLRHHAIFSDLDELHTAVVKFSVLMKYHRMFAVQMSAFSTLIKEIKDLGFQLHRERSSISSEPAAESSTPPLWMNAFFKDLNELASDIEEILKSHLTVFNIKEAKDIERIRERVEAMKELYSFRPFVSQLPPERRNLKDLLEKSIQVAVPNWFLLLSANLMPEMNSPEMQLSAFKGISEHVLNHSHRVLKGVVPIFEEAGVDYFTHFFLTVDKLISVEAQSRLEGCENPDDIITYEIYRSIKGLRKLSQFVDKRHSDDLKLSNSHKWFQRMVNNWIVLATDRCKDRIRKAIQLDKVVQITEDVHFSSSAVDGTGFLLRLMKLSDELEWPSRVEAFTFMVAIVRSACECALFYVGEVYKSLDSEDMFDERRMFRATEKLSIVLNNMQHIKQVLDICLEQHTKERADDLTKDELRLQEHTDTVLATLIKGAREDIDNKIADIICQTCKKISPDMYVFVEDIISSSIDTVDLQTIDPLMNYLTNNLQTLGNYLLTPILEVILANLWCVSNDCLSLAIESAPTKKGSNMPLFYHKLHYILESLKEFFHAGGNGLSEKDLETEQYKSLYSRLDILRLPTDKLIQKFYAHLAEQQATSVDFPLGRLLLSVGFNKDRSVVEVCMFQGHELPALDSSGFSDPFVELALMPPWLFRQSSFKKQKTSVKKKTLNPVFNEEFKLSADRQFLETEGAILLLSVFDHDIIRSNDFCGLCVVPCKDIPLLSPAESAFSDPNAVQRKNLMLPLFKLKKSTVVLKELDARLNLSDPTASEFFKNNKHILAGVDPEKL